MGEGKNGSGSLQTTIYLPAVYVTTSVSDMSTILSSITQSVRDSKKLLDDLQEVSIKASSKKKNLPQLVEIRQSLNLYWGNVANFMQNECYQTANEFALIQEPKLPSELITALEESNAVAKDCTIQAKTLVGQHDEFIRFFMTRARAVPLAESGAFLAGFMSACGALRAGLIDLLALVDKQRQVCTTFQTMARTNYTPAMLEEFNAFGKEWRPHVTKVKETYIQLRTLSNDIQGSGVKKSDECIIM